MGAPGSYINKFVAMASSDGPDGEKEYVRSTGACRMNRPGCSQSKTEEECQAECDADASCYAFQRPSKNKGWCCLWNTGVNGNEQNGRIDCFVSTNGFTMVPRQAAFEDAVGVSSLETRLASLSD